MPAFAQNARTENALQNMMVRHPELQNNPALLNNPGYLQSHKNIKAFMEHHPDARGQMLNQYGAYGPGNVWHNQNWWYNNNPDWTYANRPGWVQNHPEWRNDGDWDDQHHWHRRDWYYDHNREWAEHHHPEWGGEHGGHEHWEHHGHGHGHGWGHGHDRD